MLVHNTHLALAEFHIIPQISGPVTGHLDTGFFWVSLCLQANAEMVPRFPSCYYKPLT